jgi:hypothetical protein
MSLCLLLIVVPFFFLLRWYKLCSSSFTLFILRKRIYVDNRNLFSF